MINFGDILNTVKSFLTPKPTNANSMVDYPNVISPIQSPDQMTKGLIYDTQLDAQHAANPEPVVGTRSAFMINPSVANAPTTTPTDTNFNDLINTIKNGFTKYGSPMATAAADFANAGYKLQQQHPNVDPLIAAVLSLKETSGGKSMAPNSANNTLNLGPNINYPDIKTNLMGGGTWGIDGGPQQGFTGIMNQPVYQKYLDSGNLNDFFPSYTPTYDTNGKKVNGTTAEQIAQYDTLRKFFQ